MLIVKIALSLGAAYALVVAVIAITQTSVIFPAGIANAQAPVLPPEVDLAPPPWSAVPAPDRLNWFERFVAALRDKIDLLKRP